MLKSSQSKLEYSKRYNERKRQEKKDNGTYRPPGRPKRDTPRTADELKKTTAIIKEGVRKRNESLRERRRLEREKRQQREAELTDIVNIILKLKPADIDRLKVQLIEEYEQQQPPEMWRRYPVRLC